MATPPHDRPPRALAAGLGGCVVLLGLALVAFGGGAARGEVAPPGAGLPPHTRGTPAGGTPTPNATPGRRGTLPPAAARRAGVTAEAGVRPTPPVPPPRLEDSPTATLDLLPQPAHRDAPQVGTPLPLHVRHCVWLN